MNVSANPQHIVLVTCADWPDLSASDECLATELIAQGHRVQARAWNVARIDQFTGADLVVLRSNWDYHHDLAAFDQWLTAIDESSAVLHNPIALVRSHLDKSYIEKLQVRGVRTPRTLVTSDFDLGVIDNWLQQHNLDRVVLKPAWGASGHGVELVQCQDLTAAANRWGATADRRPMLVQEFLPQIRNGEHSLVFFGGEFSHALVRRPADEDFRVNSQYGGSMQLQADADPAMIEFASLVEAALEQPATYARIDLVIDGSSYIVMEIEVNEPALGLHLAPGSAARFAAALT